MDTLTKNELRDLAKTMKIKCSGNKSELCDRIMNKVGGGLALSKGLDDYATRVDTRQLNEIIDEVTKSNVNELIIPINLLMSESLVNRILRYYGTYATREYSPQYGDHIKIAARRMKWDKWIREHRA